MDRKCKNCGKIFWSSKKYKDSEYCHICRKYHKNCEICEKEIFVQARTCNKKCAYELRKQSWKKTCGAEHNFCKKSSSRIKWEERLFKEEGIINVWQREDVKEKSKHTLSKKYGIDVINVSQVPEIKEKIKQTFEKSGYWNIDRHTDEYDIYRCNVWEITQASIEKYWNKDWKKNNKDKIYKDKLTIDHKYSIVEGYRNKISPEIIGSIVNIEILTHSKNSAKGRKCSISLNKLINDYKNFLNENKNNY
jgi:hypothetical protein